jgi:hypothetical protein
LTVPEGNQELQGSDFEGDDFESNAADFEDSIADIESLLTDDLGIDDGTLDDIDESLNVNEYGEIEDEPSEDEPLEDEPSEDGNVDNTLDVNSSNFNDETPTSQSTNISHPANPTQNPSTPLLAKTWSKRSKLAPNETDKEFEMFKVYCMYGGGRSHQYVSQITNFGLSSIRSIAQRNQWARRSGDYDRWQLSRRIQESQDSKHKLHMQKLEVYREEQEALGKQLSLNAARIAFLANSTLSKMLSEEQNLDVRDLPSILNTASKLAEVGKNLQGGALGVEQLLNAIEESEVD